MGRFYMVLHWCGLCNELYLNYAGVGYGLADDFTNVLHSLHPTLVPSKWMPKMTPWDLGVVLRERLHALDSWVAWMNLVPPVCPMGPIPANAAPKRIALGISKVHF